MHSATPGTPEADPALQKVHDPVRLLPASSGLARPGGLTVEDIHREKIRDVDTTSQATHTHTHTHTHT
jgi:hypothetical protein